jgi:C_GCAxxG_C_C family probable redox protein
MADSTAKKAYELGRQYERTYGGCSQCVIAALQDTYDTRNDEIVKAATGLAAGGGGFTDGSCGAYAGAILALGSRLGRERDALTDIDAMQRNFGLVRQLHDRFIQEYGSVVCRNIQAKIFGRPYYLADPDEFAKFEKAGAHESHCPEVVGKACRWAAEIIEEAGLA